MFVVFDLDDTLSDSRHRMHLAREKNWDAFYLACDKDPPIQPTCELLKSLRKTGHIVEIWTGRGEVSFKQTVDWLNKHVGFAPHLRMRPADWKISNVKLKEYWLREIGVDFRPDLVIEDKLEVVEMFRSYGVRTLQICPQPHTDELDELMK